MDRPLNDGREFAPSAHELFEDHASRLLDAGKVAHRLGSQRRVAVGWDELLAKDRPER